MPTEEEIFYFDSSDAIDAVFAGDLPRNLSALESAFGAKAVARDLWVKFSSDSPDSLSRVASFIDEVIKLYKEEGFPLAQHDFDSLLEAYRNHNEQQVKDFYSERIHVGHGKPDVAARNAAQFNYINEIRDKDIVFGIGPAGTGKTYIAMAMAVSEYLAGRCSRLILTRPAREAGENLGFLPGNLQEKILPYLRPLYDALYDMLEFEQARELIEKNIIEVAPLAFMRGRTLNNAFVILDEAQNASVDQMLMFLTRLGFDSNCVVTGDPSQTDLEFGDESGLLSAKRVLGHIPEISFCSFTVKDVVRHSLVEKIINAYENERKQGGGKNKSRPGNPR